MAESARNRHALMQRYLSKGFWHPETTSELWDGNALQYPG
jgi:hypothetical protein